MTLKIKIKIFCIKFALCLIVVLALFAGYLCIQQAIIKDNRYPHTGDRIMFEGKEVVVMSRCRWVSPTTYELRLPDHSTMRVLRSELKDLEVIEK